jgi:glucokinase
MVSSTRECVFLAGDIGGTNTNLALVGYSEGNFRILLSKRFPTQEQTSLLSPIGLFLKEAAADGLSSPIDFCCVSAAGPVIDGSIRLTNASWSINAAEISERFGIKARLINDFTAISYAVVLLDTTNADKITILPHTNGTAPLPGTGMALVVGAGTGLGVGFVDKKPDGSYVAFPSEGGHSELSCSTSLEFAFHEWLAAKTGEIPGAELAISGQGISNIFDFLNSPSFDPTLAALDSEYKCAPEKTPSALDHAVLALPENERPAAIAKNSSSDFRCALTMELFVRFYARKVSNLASIFLPSGGIYLAGGISSKNAPYLLEKKRFMRVFEKNYAPHIRNFLAGASVMIVRDYSVSLIGAANAALQFFREGS